MKQLPRIPVPPGRRWREFRLRVVPGIVFLVTSAAVALIWNQHLSVSTLQGEVESVQSNVSSPHAGILTQVNVTRFQKVSQGEAVAVLIPNDPRIPLALLQSEIDLFRARLEPRLSGQRNATDYERLRLEWLLQKVQLATAQVKLARAENQLRRSEHLFREDVISADLYDSSLKTRERLKANVEESSNVVVELEKGLESLKELGSSVEFESVVTETVSTLRAHEQKLRLTEASIGPITLKAPIEGMVSFIYRRPGENVQNGDPIIALSALDSDRIIGYLRQPLSIEPEVGMQVEIRTRTAPPVVHTAQISEVGTRFEVVSEALAIQRAGGAMDVGLPIEISLPTNMRVRPGEIVDLVIHPRSL